MKCDISAVDLQFRTPLHWAAVLGLGEVVGMLMERGADLACADAVGATALHYAVSVVALILGCILQVMNVVDINQTDVTIKVLTLFFVTSLFQAQKNHVVCCCCSTAMCVCGMCASDVYLCDVACVICTCVMCACDVCLWYCLCDMYL